MHTPGPWTAIAAVAEGGDQSDEYSIKAQPHPAMRGFTKDVAMVEGEANAKLIAAAPEMLAALQFVQTFVRLNDVAQEEVAAAIAKATGEA